MKTLKHDKFTQFLSCGCVPNVKDDRLEVFNNVPVDGLMDLRAEIRGYHMGNRRPRISVQGDGMLSTTLQLESFIHKKK